MGWVRSPAVIVWEQSRKRLLIHCRSTVNLSTFVNLAGSVPAPLTKAVVRQSGGWSDFKEMAADVANHGAACGFSGWTYYTDTVKFAQVNRATIAQLAQDQWANYGTGVLEMIQGFNCIGKDYSLDEIGRCLYGKGDDTTILNGLAWFALEEVCRTYFDLL